MKNKTSISDTSDKRTLNSGVDKEKNNSKFTDKEIKKAGYSNKEIKEIRKEGIL